MVRVGIALGEVVVADNTITGAGVVLAQRVEQLAEPTGVCITAAIHESLPQRLPFNQESLGEQQVKGFDEPVRVYRVTLSQGESIPPPQESNQHEVSPQRRRLIVAVTAIVLVVAGSAVFWFKPWVMREEPASVERMAFPLPDKPSIAVLPFTNMSDDAKQEYFVDGMTDDLITDLSKLSGLFVIARNSVFSYKGKTVKVRQVAEELGVRYVLEGSVRRAGSQVRINVQLIDATSGGHVWAERFDRESSNIFAVQDETIQHIVDVLAIQLSISEQHRLERLPTTNLEAYDYYLRAEQAARTGFRPKLREALGLYEKAMALDPTFAEAFAGDARTAADIMRLNYDDILPGPIARKRAYEHAGRGLEINPEVPLPFAVLSILQTVDRRHKEALTSARRAVALGPSDAAAHAALSLVLTFSGHHADAITAIETTMRLNPNLSTGDSIVAGLAFILSDMPERAIEILERASAKAPNVDDIHAMLTAAYARANRVDDARLAAAEAVRLGPNLCVELYRVILAHFRSDLDLAKIVDAMREGGLQEWPYGFTAESHARLTATEIGRLVLGRTWQGRIEGGGPAFLQFQLDGKLAYRTATSFATGVAFVNGDTLCEQYKALSLGRSVCGPVYRLSKTSSSDDLTYAYANASKVLYFSPIE
jgi:TolB-like protein/tetratricopeptide (TPR) repeat protein